MKVGGTRRSRSRRTLVGRMGIVLAIGLGGFFPAFGQGDRSIERLSGQTVAPVYDGFEINSDGTYSMWFSYFKFKLFNKFFRNFFY